MVGTTDSNLHKNTSGKGIERDGSLSREYWYFACSEQKREKKLILSVNPVNIASNKVIFFLINFGFIFVFLIFKV